MANELRRPLRLLVVDSEAETRDTVTTLLEWRDYGVFVAATGAEALAIMRHHSISVALIVLALPDICGYEVAATIHSELGARAPTCIALSSYFRPVERARMRDAGFIHHVMKPTSAAMLYNAIDTVR